MPKPILQSLMQNFREALLQRRFADAEAALAKLKKEDPASLETRGLELELCVESGRLAEADRLAEQLSLAFPGSARICFLAGKLAYRRKRYEAAADHFRESLRLYPSPQTRYWLGKTLTQTGDFEQAESLLSEVSDSNPWALLVLGWLHERREDYESALRAYDEFLRHRPGDTYAAGQRVRLKAKMLDPEVLIEEVQSLAEFGEPMPDQIFPEYVQGLFETGQTGRAREEVSSRMSGLQGRDAVQLAWICYRHQAYDFACSLFLAQLQANVFNFKYLAALEASARKCNRLDQVLDAYKPLRPEARHLYGRCKRLS